MYTKLISTPEELLFRTSHTVHCINAGYAVSLTLKGLITPHRKSERDVRFMTQTALKAVLL